MHREIYLDLFLDLRNNFVYLFPLKWHMIDHFLFHLFPGIVEMTSDSQLL